MSGTRHAGIGQKLDPGLTGVSVAVAAETVAIDRYIRRRYIRIVPGVCVIRVAVVGIGKWASPGWISPIDIGLVIRVVGSVVIEKRGAPPPKVPVSIT